MQNLQIRIATEADCVAINDIYNYYVVHSTCTYQTEIEPIQDRLAWFAGHGPKYPITVAEADGVVVGWGSLSPFHLRAGYARTVENSVYVHHDWQRRGIGKIVLADLIDRAGELGHHTIIAGISGEQTASLILHEKLGFVRVGELKEAGYKMNQWLDVIYMQKML